MLLSWLMWTNVSKGHCHPKIVATLVEQAQKLTLSSRAFYNSVFPHFAKQMKETFGYDCVLPMNTGAEAVETALKVARKWAYETPTKNVDPGKAIVLSPGGNFHGRTLGVISMSTDPESRDGFGPYLAGVGPIYKDQDGTVQTIRYGHIEDLERALDHFGKNVAAFLLEPIQGEAGFQVSSFPQRGISGKFAKYVRSGMFSSFAMKFKRSVRLPATTLSDADHRHLTTGTGTDWEDALLRARGYSTRYSFIGEGTFWRRSVELVPSVVVRIIDTTRSGSIVYPVSAVLADRAVMDCIGPGQHGSTYGGNPLGCAVAMTALDVIQEERLAEKAERLGQIFRERMNAVKEKSPLIKVVRGRGLLNAVVIDESASLKGHTAWQFCLLLKSRGVLAKPTHVNIIRFAPPLVISDEELETAMGRIEQCLYDFDKVGGFCCMDSFKAA
ncbi:ornithine aminotransferase [Lanmaoa asiatica]|nr:ornithine aminotransferase [Lanmaoa asiatica]